MKIKPKVKKYPNGGRQQFEWSKGIDNIQPITQTQNNSSITTGNKKLSTEELKKAAEYTKKYNQQHLEEEYNNRQNKLKQSIDAQKQPLSLKNLQTQTQSTGDKFSLAMNSKYGNPKDYPTLSGYMQGLDYINPAKMIGDMTSGLGSVPQDVNDGNYLKAGLSVASPLAVGAIAGVGANSVKPFVNNLVNPLAGTGEVINNLGNKYLPNAYKLNPLAKKGFNSEINWGKWNKEIPENKALMQEYNAIDYKKNPLSDKEKEMYQWFDEQMRFDKLPQTTNKQSIEVLDNFKQRIRTPEGQKRLKELGITEEQLLQDLKIVEDSNTYGYYRGAKNTIAMNPNHPLPKKVVRHEIEHGVQNALRQSKINKVIDGTPAEKLKALESTTTEIDDILSGLTLRREGTPDKKWIGKAVSDKPVQIDEYKALINNKQNATDYFLTGSDGAEKSAFLGEIQQYMMDTGKIPKDSYVQITPEMVEETMIDAMFDEAGGGKYLRLFNIIKADPKNYELISKGLNKMLTVSPLIGAGAYMQNKEYKNGGVIGNNGMFDMTNPNIYKSILPIGLGLGAASQIDKKQNGGSLNKYPNGGREPIVGTPQQYQAYQDSLDLYNLYKFQEGLTGTAKTTPYEEYLNRADLFSMNQFGSKAEKRREKLGRGDFSILKWTLGIGEQKPITNRDLENYERKNLIPLDDEKYELNYISKKVIDKIKTINNPRITYVNRNSPDFYHKNIKPTEAYLENLGKEDSAIDFKFTKPVQPIVLKPTITTTVGDVAGDKIAKSKNNVAVLNSKLVLKNRPKEQFQELNTETQYLPESNFHLDFDPIGLKKGTYFTRPRQQQEAGRWKLVDYFDSKTGKLLKTIEKKEFGGNITTESEWELVNETNKKLPKRRLNLNKSSDWEIVD